MCVPELSQACGERAEHTGTCMEVFHRVKQEQKRKSSFPQYDEVKCKADEILSFWVFCRQGRGKKGLGGHHGAQDHTSGQTRGSVQGSIARLSPELLQPTKPHCLNVKPRSVLLPACQLRDPQPSGLTQSVVTACPKGIAEMETNLCIYDFALNNLMLTLTAEEKWLQWRHLLRLDLL